MITGPTGLCGPSPLRACLLGALALYAAAPSRCQEVLGLSAAHPGVQILNSDLAVLEAGENRDDLPCTVSPVKPALGYDMSYHSGYHISVPLRELAGQGDALRILFRVRPDDPGGTATYFSQRLPVPAIASDARGEAYLQGKFDLGPGKYKVDWLMRDREERVCASFWDADASLSSDDADMPIEIPAGEARAAVSESFAPDPLEKDPAGKGALKLKVLVNFAPLNPNNTIVGPDDEEALISTIRTIARQPRIASISLVVFNLQQMEVFFRQDPAPRVDFPAFGEAVKKLNTGTVHVATLALKHGETEFLAGLVRNEFRSGRPDALVFVGPKVSLDENLSRDELAEISAPDYPVFSISYAVPPPVVVFNDAISRTVKFFKGSQYVLARPRDLWEAVRDILSRASSSQHNSH